jgi:hypothetical protein
MTPKRDKQGVSYPHYEPRQQQLPPHCGSCLFWYDDGDSALCVHPQSVDIEALDQAVVLEDDEECAVELYKEEMYLRESEGQHHCYDQVCDLWEADVACKILEDRVLQEMETFKDRLLDYVMRRKDE